MKSSQFSQFLISLYCIRTYISYIFIYFINVNLYTTIFYCNVRKYLERSKNIALKTVTKQWLLHFLVLFLATKKQKNRMAEIKLWIRRGGDHSRSGPLQFWVAGILEPNGQGMKGGGAITTGTDGMEQRQSYVRGQAALTCCFSVRAKRLDSCLVIVLLIFGLKKLKVPGCIKA